MRGRSASSIGVSVPGEKKRGNSAAQHRGNARKQNRLAANAALLSFPSFSLPAPVTQSSGFAPARARNAAAGSACATDGAAIAADREIHRAEVTTAALAVRLATQAARRAIRRDGRSVLPRLLVAAGPEILVYDFA